MLNKKYRLPLLVCSIFALSACDDSKEPEPEIIVSYPALANDFSSISIDASSSRSLSDEENTLEYAWQFDDRLITALSNDENGKVTLTLADVSSDEALDFSVTITDVEANTKASESFSLTVTNSRTIITSETPMIVGADVHIKNTDGDIIASTITDDNGSFLIETSQINYDNEFLIALTNGTYTVDDNTVENRRNLSIRAMGGDINASSTVLSMPKIAVNAALEGIEDTISFDELITTKEKYSLRLLSTPPENKKSAYENLSFTDAKRPKLITELNYLEQVVDFNDVIYDDFYSAYLSVESDDDASALLANYFTRFFNFNERDTTDVKSTFIRIGVIGDGKVSDGNTINLDSSSPDFKTVTPFLVEQNQTEFITLTAQEHAPYEFDFWAGCEILTADNKCLIPVGSKANVTVYFKPEEPVFNEQVIDLTSHEVDFDNDTATINLILGADEVTAQLENASVGHYLVGPQGGGFTVEITNIEKVDAQNNEFIFTVKKVQLADMIKSGGFNFNRRITNLDIFNTTPPASQGQTYSPGTFVLMDGNTGILLGDDPYSDVLVIATANDPEDVSGSGSYSKDYELDLSGGPLNLTLTSTISVSSRGSFDMGLLGVNSASFGMNFEAANNGKLSFAYTVKRDGSDLRKKSLKRLARERVVIPFRSIPIGAFVWVTPRVILSAYNDAKFAQLDLNGFVEAGITGKVGFNVLYTDNGGTSGDATGDLSPNTAKYEAKAELVVEATAGLNLGVTINSIEIPVSLGTSLTANFTALAEDYTGKAKQCTAVIKTSINGAANFSVGTTYSDGIDVGFWTIPVNAGDIRYDIYSKSQKLYEGGFSFTEDRPECYAPSYKYSGKIQNKTIQDNNSDWLTLTNPSSDFPTMKNEALVTGHYEVKIANDDLWRITRATIVDGKESGTETLSDGDSYEIDGKSQHEFSVEFNVSKFRKQYTSGNANFEFEIIPTELPLAGYGKTILGKTFTANIKVAPANPPAVTNISINSLSSSYPTLTWSYSTVIERLYGNSGLEYRIFLNDVYVKSVRSGSRSAKIRIDSYGNNTFSIVPVTRFGSGDTASYTATSKHPYSGLYTGTFSWNCGLFMDNNGNYYINKGTAYMEVSVNVSSPSARPSFTSFISEIAQNSGQFNSTSPLRLYAGASQEFRGRITPSNITLEGYNGPNCSHPTIYWGASSASLSKQ